MDSILDTIKQLLGISSDQTHFDTDIIVHINRAISRLRRLGVGPAKGYRITDRHGTWNDIIQDSEKLEDVKTFVYLKVKLIFDPPLSSAAVTAMKEEVKELEWELNVTAESTLDDEEEV